MGCGTHFCAPMAAPVTEVNPRSKCGACVTPLWNTKKKPQLRLFCKHADPSATHSLRDKKSLNIGVGGMPITK